MSVIIPPGYGLARLIFALAGDPEPMNTTFGCISIAEDPSEWPATINAAFISSGLGTAANILTQYTWLGSEVTFMDESGPVLYADTLDNLGTRTGIAAPSNCAMLVNKSTARGGRQGRGRFYFPPYQIRNDEVSSTGLITAGIRTTINGRMEAFHVALSTLGMTMVLLHSDSDAPDTITNLFLQTTIATQRRRLR